jgi:hypothetical protein
MREMQQVAPLWMNVELLVRRAEVGELRQKSLNNERVEKR